MYKWKKTGQIFDPTTFEENTWMEEYAQAPSVVIFDDYIRIYFSSRQKMDENKMYISRLGYIDVQRDNLFNIINYSKTPILPLGDLGTFDEFGTYPASVIKVNKEIRAYYAGWTRCESVPFNAAIGVAASKDNGKTFEKIGKGPVLSFTPDEPFVIGSPKIRFFNGNWYLWYAAAREWLYNEGSPQPVYKIRMAHSSDGLNWTRVGKDLIKDVLEVNECQASADVLFRDGKYHMLFSYRYNLNYRNKNRGYQIGYASSIDLFNWERDDSKAGICKSESGWDGDSVSYPFVFELDGKTLMLYQGNEIGKCGFGLAELDE